MGEQVKNEFAPQVIAPDPVAEGIRWDHDSLGFLFDRGNGREILLAQDRIGSQYAGFAVAETVERDLPPCFTYFVYPDYARYQKRNCINVVTFDKYIAALGDVSEECCILEFLQ